jgi:hypothetical protein
MSQFSYSDPGQGGGGVKSAFACLLRDGPPPDIDLAACSPYQEEIETLISIREQGGVKAVRESFAAMTKLRPNLAVIIAGQKAEPRKEWTIAELLSTDFPEPQWAAPDLVPVGLSFLAGRPKVGKSWLGLQLAEAVGSGGSFLGRAVEQGRVLYLALEDSGRRLKMRAEAQQIGPDAQVVFRTEWPFLDEGGMDELIEELDERPVSLLVIDTFSKILSHADQNEGAEMTAILSRLHRTAHDMDLSILLIDHHRKSARGSYANPVDDLLGSTAKAAVADVALGLYRNQNGEVILKATGRDIEEQELTLKWDQDGHRWDNMGPADTVRADSSQWRILRSIAELIELGEPATTTRLAFHCGAKPGNISRDLSKLIAEGRCIKLPKQGRDQPYGLPEGK